MRTAINEIAVEDVRVFYCRETVLNVEQRHQRGQWQRIQLSLDSKLQNLLFKANIMVLTDTAILRYHQSIYQSINQSINQSIIIKNCWPCLRSRATSRSVHVRVKLGNNVGTRLANQMGFQSLTKYRQVVDDVTSSGTLFHV